MGSTSAAAPHAVARRAHRVEHRRRLDHVRRDRHGRVRAAAARARRRARRSRRPHLSDAMFSMLTDDGARRRRRHGRYAYGLSQEAVDGHRWIAHSGGMVGYTALLAVVARRRSRARDPAERRRRQAGHRRGVRARRGPREPRRRRVPRDLGTARADRRSRRPQDYVGRYLGDDGRALDVDAVEDGLGRHDRAPRPCASSAILWQPERGRRVPRRARRARSVPVGVRARRRRDGRRGVPRADLVPR